METRPQQKNHPFLQGGGEMGALIRNYDWYGTNMSTPDKWPQALQISLTNVLNSGFPMFLFWGKDLTCFYNDAFRPSLGVNGKHPAIGKSGKEVWPEIWDFIGPLIQGVLDTGRPVWFENQLVPFYRNGSIEDIYWTFSYSLLTDDDGNPGGVLVTCMETTGSVLGRKKLEESQDRLHFALQAGQLGSWQLDLNNFELKASSICKQIFGQPVDQPFTYERLQNTIHPADRERQKAAVMHTIDTGADYDLEYRVVWPDESVHWVNIRGQLRYDQNNRAESMVGVSLDITDRKESETKLQESEEQFRNMIEQAPLAIALTRGQEMIFESINMPMLQIIHKKSKEEVIGSSLKEVLPELVHQPVYHILLQVLATGETFKGTEVAAELEKDGVLKRRYFNLTYSRIVDKDGIPSILHMSTDVTDQVLARKNIEESEGRFRLLADAAPNFIWMLRPDGSYGYVNKTTLNFLGVTQEQIGTVGWEPFQHPDDLEATTQAINTAVQNGAPYQLEHRLRHKDGEYRWVLSQAIPAYDAAGKIFAYVGSSIDIHEAKHNRQELQRALEQVRLSKEAAELGTFDMDLEKGTMHWDDRCRTLFGITHHEPVSYEHDFVSGLHPDDREKILNRIDQLFYDPNTKGDYDVEYRTVGAEDGVVRWVRAKGKVYFTRNNKPVRFIGSVLDITEKAMAIQKIESLVEERTKQLARANESLQVINKELQRSNANLEEFAHAASHDLKEPIRKIHFFTQQLREQLGDRLKEGELRSFSRIENATQRMGNLIDDLLIYSHVSQRPHETEAIVLNESVMRVLEDLDLDIEEKKATIHIGKLPVVQGYRRQLQQLFQNLLSNALKYSKADTPPAIEITAAEKELLGKPHHLIEIRDNGIGFEQEYADKIFQMFARLHGKSEYSGTGVGLSIVKKVVENHHGYIEVDSEPGKGSTFGIYLPIK